MSDCCDKNAFDGASLAYRRALIAVIAINAVMFCVEMSAGVLSGSQALKADALDFAGDTATYGLSLFVALCASWALKTGYLWFSKRNKAAFTYLAIALGLVGVASLTGQLKPASSWTQELRTIQAAAVQSNVDQRLKWTGAQQTPTLNFYKIKS